VSDKVDYGEYDQETYAAMEQGGNAMDQQRFQRNFVNGSGCTNGSCQNKSNPGEEPWLQLMSAIPVKGQIGRIKAIPSGMATPNDMEVSEIVAQYRGADGDDYSMEAVKDGWKEFLVTFDPLESDFTSALEALTQEWAGDDLDAFTDQADIVKTNLGKIKEDIGTADGNGGGSGALALLEQKEQSVYALQGGDSGEVLYPAPLIWTDDRGFWKSAQFHVRPAFWSGECKIIDDACSNDSGNDILKMAGFNPDGEGSNYRDEVNNFEQARSDYYFEYYNSEANGFKPGSFSRDQANNLAAEDANAQITEDVQDLDDNYQQRLDNINNDITGRRDMASSEVSTFKPTVTKAEPTTFNEGQPTNQYPGTNPGGGGSMPSAGGSLNPPSFDSPTPDTPSTPPFNPPNPDGFDPPGTGGIDPPGTGGIDPGGLDDNPWDSNVPDPDDISGGLASGGGLGSGGLGGGLGGGVGGGAGGGMGGGAGGGLGAGGLGGGMAGGMMGGAGGGRGAGAGAGGGRGAGGRGAGGGPKGMGAGRGGMAGGMMGGAGGGRGMGGQGEGEQETGTWLTEDDDVWGIGNEESDPYT
jgi:hypothetical protein